jgi:hypothetical protein
MVRPDQGYPRNRLGLEGEERVDILNVKLDDPLLADLLVRRPGCFRGYHIRPGELDLHPAGRDGACRGAPGHDRQKLSGHRAPRQRKKELRPPGNGSSPRIQSITTSVHAFDGRKEIDWKQGAGIRTGDTVFLYAAAPVSAILYRCKVKETDIPFEFAHERLTIKA